MEGYLFKKGRGESKIGRHNWKKRWFVLDGAFLSYYDDIDLKTNKPFNRKGVVPVLGCEAKIFPHHDKKFTFHLTHPTRSALYLHATDPKMMNRE